MKIHLAGLKLLFVDRKTDTHSEAKWHMFAAVYCDHTKKKVK